MGGKPRPPRPPRFRISLTVEQVREIYDDQAKGWIESKERSKLVGEMGAWLREQDGRPY